MHALFGRAHAGIGSARHQRRDGCAGRRLEGEGLLLFDLYERRLVPQGRRGRSEGRVGLALDPCDGAMRPTFCSGLSTGPMVTGGTV